MGVFTFDPYISTNIISQLVQKFLRHAPGHSACRHPICGVTDLCIISESGITVCMQWLELEGDEEIRYDRVLMRDVTVNVRRVPEVRVGEGGRGGIRETCTLGSLVVVVNVNVYAFTSPPSMVALVSGRTQATADASARSWKHHLCKGSYRGTMTQGRPHPMREAPSTV